MALSIALAGCGGPLLVWFGRSPDRELGARIVEEAGAQQMIVGDAPDAPVDAIALGQLRWMPRGVAYPARVGDRWRVFANGVPGREHDAIGAIVTAGERLAYAALDGERWSVIVDGSAGPAFQSLRAGTLRLAREGRRVVYVGRDLDGERAVVDGEIGPAFDRIGMLTIGAKGALVGYVGWADERASIVMEHVVRASAEDVLALALASHEPRFGAIVMRGGEPAIVHDGRWMARAPGATRLAISAEGAHLAWITRAGEREQVWLDGQSAGEHDAIEDLRFVPRTGALVYIARDGERVRVVHAGVAGPHAAAIDMVLTSDSGQWGYVARRGAGRFVVIDGELRYRGEWAGALALAQRSERWAFVARRAYRRFVVTPDARVEIGRPFVDTLVLDPLGTRWAIAVADARARRVDVLVDGRAVAALDLDEVGAAITEGREPVEAVRAIVRGELARARARD